MLMMIHSNPVRLEGGVFRGDRKFHTGMREYLKELDMPILSVHPRLAADKDSAVMDWVDVPEAELGYRVMTLNCSGQNKPLPEELARLRPEMERSKLVYSGGFAARAIGAVSAETRVPYVGLLEYNLRTVMVFSTANVQGAVPRMRKRLGAIGFYAREMIPFTRNATLLHCNGYPIYEETKCINENRLLYLDSRMDASSLIPEPRLRERLSGRRRRIPRLIFSGRFEPAKGALDVVKIAGELASLDVPFEFVLYGQGSQRTAMDQMIAERGLSERVKIHDPIPYPRLVDVSRDCDIFVCCHVQDDPSCTYLESMGSGLPIIGYGNAMWKAMQADSRAGRVTKLGSPAQAARSIKDLLAQADELDALSKRARSFAAAHTFEREFAKRTASLKACLSDAARRRPA